MSFVSLEDFFSKQYNITDPDALSDLAEASSFYEVPKGTLFYRAGVVQTEIKLLVDGIARGFIHDEYGKDITECFVVDVGWPLLGGVDFDQPSQKSVVAVTDASIVEIPISKFSRLVDLYPEVMVAYNKLLSEAFTRITEEKRIIGNSPAAIRYQWFLECYPGISGKVKQMYIASFLNMTPVSLSRLRRKYKVASDAKRPEIPQKKNIAAEAPTTPVQPPLAF